MRDKQLFRKWNFQKWSHFKISPRSMDDYICLHELIYPSSIKFTLRLKFQIQKLLFLFLNAQMREYVIELKLLC